MPTAVPIDPDRLLASARLLANHVEGRGRPSPVFLRRAVSSAYYALFHSMTRQAAEHLLPHGTTDQQLHLVRRFNHGELKTVCGWIGGQQGIGSGRMSASIRSVVDDLKPTPIRIVATTFWDLQEERHAADYDHFTSVAKGAALTQIDLAGRAVQTLTNSDAKDRSAFFTLLAVASNPR